MSFHVKGTTCCRCCVRPVLCCPAGAFCTPSYVVGTGAYVRASINNQPNAESATYAQFYALGVDNGQVAGGFPPTAARQIISPAMLLSRTIIIRNADGKPRTDALRVNGAAVKPRCQ